MTALCQSHHCRPPHHGGPRPANHPHPLCATCEARVAEHLRDIADLWPDTEEALRAPSGGTGRAEPVSGSRTHRLPLNEDVADARAHTLTTLAYWSQVVAAAAGYPPPAAFTLETIPNLARWLATHHLYLTRNDDEGVCISIAHDAHDLRRQLRRVTYPSGARRFPGRHEAQLPCVEHTTDDTGARTPCPGVYYAWITDRMDGFPDLRCTEDPEHTLTPAGFRRLGRATLDPDGTRNLLAAITG